MKKFSRIATLGATAAAAFAIVACSPPGEVDSDIKLDNASTFENQSSSASSSESESASAEPSTTAEAAAGEQAQFIDCVAAPVTEPTSISLDCTSNSDLVTEISWESWEAETAEGTGTRGNDEVAVVLSQPTQTENGLAFTQIEVDGEVVTP